MISVDRLSKWYEDYLALNDISLYISAGELIIFLGANGSGKSTLFKCLAGITDFDGSISVNNYDPIREGKIVRQHIGFMAQFCGLHPDLTIEETLKFYSSLRKGNLDDTFLLLDRAGLSGKRFDKISSLSGGMKQRLQFVVALIGNPEILLLDEPLASLDMDSAKLLSSWIRELKQSGKTILISTHLGSDIQLIADRFIVLEDGKISHRPIEHFIRFTPNTPDEYLKFIPTGSEG